MRSLTFETPLPRPWSLPWRSMLTFALERVPALVALVALPLWWHLGFSHLGFNPTDEGFTLAYSRRILDGQVPHRDFISIRPAGSPLLHVPEVALGGDRTFWLSRGVAWFELGLLAWASVTLLARLLQVSPPWWVRLYAMVAAFLFCAHTFPVMAWHTIDGLAVSSLGLVLATTDRTHGKVAGYALLGFAALTKQNFAVVGPAALALLGDWRRGEYLLAYAAAPLAYVGLLIATGGIDDAAVQLFTETGLSETGWAVYARRPALLGMLALGFIGTHLTRSGPRPARMAGAGVLVSIVGWSALGIGDRMWFDGAPFDLLAASVGATAWFLPRGVRHPAFLGAALVAATAWASAISVGYNTPALASGMMAACLLLVAWGGVEGIPLGRVVYVIPVVAVVVLAWNGVVEGRHQHIYRDAPEPELVYDLGSVLPGASGIRTNPTTYAMAADLQRATALMEGQRYAIVPEFAAYWAQADQANPLPLDWLWWLEMDDPRLRDRILWQLDAQRGALVVLVQKWSVELSPALAPPVGDRWIIPHIQEVWTPVAETEYFTLYR